MAHSYERTAAIGVGLSALLGCAPQTPMPRLDRGLADASVPTLRAASPDSSIPEQQGPCPEGMALVKGTYCPYVGHRCVDWIQQGRDRCREYAPPPICEGRLEQLSYCVDRFEYPNLKGVLPVVMVSFIEAQEACEQEGKRLCTEKEWTFACEGEEQLPHPYGYRRDATACNIDRPYALPDFDAFSVDKRIADEVARIDQRVASGSQPRCKSPFGVFDMTGNVDEWTVNELPDRDAGVDVSSLKGGYFGPIRARCRPTTRSHNRWFRFYQVGFRCCQDVPSGSRGS